MGKRKLSFTEENKIDLKVFVVVVLYNKSIDELEYLDDFQGIDVLIYDNSPQAQVAPKQFLYYHDSGNSGVSAAYNYGIKLAKKQSADYLLILDHDTNFSKNNLTAYLDSAAKFGDNYIYTPIVKNGERIYSPYLEGKNRNYPQQLDDFTFEAVYSLQNKSLINSGLMIPINLFNKLGLFNQEIKLDFSDTYYIEKYKKNYKNAILVNVFLEHRLSGDEGKNKDREFGRFKYYCNGAREFRKSAEDKLRVDRLVIFRMLRLITKYYALSPLYTCLNYYIRNKKI